MQVRQGYVHVWGDASHAAYIDAAAKPPMLVPELDPDAESAVLRDGTEPLHAGKRYLRGRTLLSPSDETCRACAVVLRASALVHVTSDSKAMHCIHPCKVLKSGAACFMGCITARL